MKTANKRQGIPIAKIPELALVRALAPERRYARRWLWRARGLAKILRHLLLSKPAPVRVYAPGARPELEHEWRRQRLPKIYE